MISQGTPTGHVVKMAAGGGGWRWGASAAVLFLLGWAFGMLFTHLQAQHRVTVYQDDRRMEAWSSGLSAAGGAAAVLVGTAFAYTDARTSTPTHRPPPTASDVLRCMGFFLGMNYGASVHAPRACTCACVCVWLGGC
jgi:hypothetical protein